MEHVGGSLLEIKLESDSGEGSFGRRNATVRILLQSSCPESRHNSSDNDWDLGQCTNLHDCADRRKGNVPQLCGQQPECQRVQVGLN